MNKDEQKFLIGAAAIGLTILIAKSIHDASQEEAENIGKIPVDYIKVGRIKATIAKQAGIEPGDIVINNNYLRHIKNRHGSEIFPYNKSILKYISAIADSFDQIRQGSDDSILLVLRDNNRNDVIGVQLTPLIDDKGKNLWEIHTAQPREKFNRNQIIIWER